MSPNDYYHKALLYTIQIKVQSARPTFPFLTLPSEIRLQVYAKCTTLTLLQLAHTSSQIYQEINAEPAIIMTSRGYWRRRNCRGQPGTPRTNSCMRYCTLAPLDTPKCTGRIPLHRFVHGEGLSINDVKLIYNSERLLFERHYEGEVKRYFEMQQGDRRVDNVCLMAADHLEIEGVLEKWECERAFDRYYELLKEKRYEKARGAIVALTRTETEVRLRRALGIRG
ncbi:hypothetical protein BJ508DRAFT_329295 [Ascobolus immersus RN42]|uniref:F-box domain-containing protein n=1 Tax=Ascobolus immersus RN42 TaxID=1160509 RepID=A0A3N4I986_ASCIM|nr:hypothetical protein BJ508DRAFT_329295 [Ascobolus immersus RN42]